jgi:hypothetical protein
MTVSKYVMPPGGSKPARDLTQAEARDLTIYYALNDVVDLEHPVAYGTDGNPTFPKAGAKVRLGLEIAGVCFAADSPAAKDWTRTGPLDLRTVVLLVRLSQYLNASKWAVTTIYWGGLGVGRSDTDRHGKGFALDFHGAETRVGPLDVARDWGNQPITLPDGKKAKQWPVNVRPYYRLDVDTNAGGFFYDV